jgi:hypothetical protein
MTDNLPPIMVGTAGLTGRPQRVRNEELEQPDGYLDDGTPFWDTPRAVGRAIPPNCLRVLFSPLPADRGGGCSMDCPGKQHDGGCLCDLVRDANAQGIDWSFEIDREGFWNPVWNPNGS